MGALEKLEAYFHWHGALVARRPYAVICFCLVITAISCLGLIKFKEEREMVNLWVEPASRFRQENSWVQENFPRELRIHQVMFRQRTCSSQRERCHRRPRRESDAYPS